MRAVVGSINDVSGSDTGLSAHFNASLHGLADERYRYVSGEMRCHTDVVHCEGPRRFWIHFVLVEGSFSTNESSCDDELL